MSKFNWKLINQPNTVVHCETEEQARELLTEADRMGFRWCHRDKYFDGDIMFEHFGHYTCYCIYEGKYDSLYYFKSNNLKILTFEESKMKNKLEVTLKIQPDGKTVVAECTSISDVLRGIGVLAEKDEYKICSEVCITVEDYRLYVRGRNKDYDYCVDSWVFETTQEAQEYVRIMNELIDEINNEKVDWSKVEKGARVKYWIVGGDLKGLVTATFHSYEPELHKVLVIVGQELKVLYESEVELM